MRLKNTPFFLFPNKILFFIDKSEYLLFIDKKDRSSGSIDDDYKDRWGIVRMDR